MRHIINALRLVAVPVGVVVGVWTAGLTWIPSQCPNPARHCVAPSLTREATFAGWECALFGLGAAAVLVLVAEAVHRLALREDH